MWEWNVPSNKPITSFSVFGSGDSIIRTSVPVFVNEMMQDGITLFGLGSVTMRAARNHVVVRKALVSSSDVTPADTWFASSAAAANDMPAGDDAAESSVRLSSSTRDVQERKGTASHRFVSAARVG